MMICVNSTVAGHVYSGSHPCPGPGDQELVRANRVFAYMEFLPLKLN